MIVITTTITTSDMSLTMSMILTTTILTTMTRTSIGTSRSTSHGITSTRVITNIITIMKYLMWKRKFTSSLFMTLKNTKIVTIMMRKRHNTFTKLALATIMIINIMMMIGLRKRNHTFSRSSSSRRVRKNHKMMIINKSIVKLLLKKGLSCTMNHQLNNQLKCLRRSRFSLRKRSHNM